MRNTIFICMENGKKGWEWAHKVMNSYTTQINDILLWSIHFYIYMDNDKWLWCANTTDNKLLIPKNYQASKVSCLI